MEQNFENKLNEFWAGIDPSKVPHRELWEPILKFIRWVAEVQLPCPVSIFAARASYRLHVSKLKAIDFIEFIWREENDKPQIVISCMSHKDIVCNTPDELEEGILTFLRTTPNSDMWKLFSGRLP